MDWFHGSSWVIMGHIHRVGGLIWTWTTTKSSVDFRVFICINISPHFISNEHTYRSKYHVLRHNTVIWMFCPLGALRLCLCRVSESHKSCFDSNDLIISLLRNVTQEDEGSYHCEASNQNETIKSQPALLLPAGKVFNIKHSCNCGMQHFKHERKH